MIIRFSYKLAVLFFMVLFFFTVKSYSQTSMIAPPLCTTLSSPLSGSVGVPVNTILSWNEASGATGYKLTIGTTSGGTDILNAFDVGDVELFDLTANGINLPEATTIFVTITPYNLDGDAEACEPESFNTFASGVLRPICTTLISPMAGDIRVPLETDLSWEPISNAAGYKLTVGTTEGGGEILNLFDVENVLNYTLNLPEFTLIYVRVTPYNISGDALDCEEESFTTKSLVPVPSCTSLLLPLNNATNVPVDAGLEWSPVSDATGYMLTLETFTTGTDVLNIFDLGDVTSYTPPADLPKNRTILVTIVPYNIGGEAIDCIEETFVTGGTRAADIPPKFFTPNNDSSNDYWIVPDPLNRVSKVFIYNRYGKLLKQIDNISAGWDGTFNGKSLSTDDYWYQIIYNDGEVLKGHFSLVR